MTDENFNNAAGSSTIGLVTSFLLNEVLPWTIHTLAALLSGVVVAVGLFFLNRWLKKNWK